MGTGAEGVPAETPQNRGDPTARHNPSPGRPGRGSSSRASVALSLEGRALTDFLSRSHDTCVHFAGLRTTGRQGPAGCAPFTECQSAGVRAELQA